MGSRIRRSLRLLVLLCTGLVIAGCATKVAYNFLDWAISWKVQRLVSLDGEQKDQAKAAIRKFHSWHRKTQLPQYAAYLEGLQERLNKGKLNADDIHAETDKVQLLLDQSLEYVLPDVVMVLSQLDQAHTTELLNSIEEEREEYIDEHVDISRNEQMQKRYDKFKDHFKDWLGKPSSKQKKQIKDWVKSLEPYEALSAKQQKTWQQEIAKLLAQRQDTEVLGKGLRKLMFYRTDNWDEELENVMDRNQARTYALIADLLNTMSDDQRRHLNKKIDDFIEIFNELSREGK